MYEQTFFFPAAAAESSPFVLRLAGSSYCDGNYRIERRNSDVWVVEYVESGTGTLELDGRVFHPGRGDLYLVPEGSTHCYYSSASDPWVKHWMNFSGPLARELVRLYRLEEVAVVGNFSRPELFKEALRRFRQHPEGVHRTTGPEFLMAVIATMASDLSRANVPPPRSDDGERLRAWLDTLVFEPAPGLDRMAEKISKSRAQTIRIFRRSVGETPVQYLLNRKLDAARELLRNSAMSLKEIAAALHFSDEYYFACMFKRRTGIAPGRYRNARRKEC